MADKLKNEQAIELEKAQQAAFLTKIAVIGSRGFIDYALLKKTLDKYTISQIISGGAKGADSLAERYALENCIPTLIYKPDYNKYGKGEPLMRNKDIVKAAGLVIAFWDGVSRGTNHLITYAQSEGKQVVIIRYDK